MHFYIVTQHKEKWSKLCSKLYYKKKFRNNYFNLFCSLMITICKFCFMFYIFYNLFRFRMILVWALVTEMALVTPGKKPFLLFFENIWFVLKPKILLIVATWAVLNYFNLTCLTNTLFIILIFFLFFCFSAMNVLQKVN